MLRCLDNILTAWNEYVAPLPAHPAFKKWTGIFLVSAALTRRVWIQADPTMPFIFPNLWILLVGPPASGKDMVSNRVSDCFDEINEKAEDGMRYYLGEESLSAKGLVDSLASEEARSTLRYLNGSQKEETAYFHSLIGCIPELGTFMPEYNTQLVSIMNDLYNCKKHFRDRIRGGINKGQRVEIINPHISFLLGTQPETLASIFPESAFKMGFFSRTILIYGDTPVRRKLFNKDRSVELPRQLWSKLVNDIRSLSYLSGEMTVTDETQEAMNHFHLVGCDETALEHSRFADYNMRRTFHLQKLAIVFSVSESPSKLIELHHWEQAKEVLFEAEKVMQNAFMNLVSDRGFHSTVEEITHGRGGKEVSHREIERILRRKHAAYEIPHLFKSMQASGDLVDIGRKDQHGQPIYLVSTRAAESLK